MYKELYPLLTTKELDLLYDTLHFMKMAELKSACTLFLLPESGKKGELIKRIMIFVESGKILKPKSIPEKSLAKNYPKQPLKPDSLMLYGGYKNDAKTREFFKKLVGPHLNFHFTAFGVDWLNDRWLEGNPPTYQEFANYWILETERRKYTVASPKK